MDFAEFPVLGRFRAAGLTRPLFAEKRFAQA